MEIVLVRHAEPEWAREGLSIDNPGLTERGHQQARLLGERFAHERFDHILVSPMVRADQTAAAILDTMRGPEPVVENWLEEIRMPDWTGTPSEEVEELFRVASARPPEEHWDGMAGGETFRDFHERVTKGVETLLGDLGITRHAMEPLWEVDQPEARALFVAHAGTNATIISHLLGIEATPWEWERFVMFHASFSVLRPVRIGHGFSFSLYRLGDCEHLPGEMRTR